MRQRFAKSEIVQPCGVLDFNDRPRDEGVSNRWSVRERPRQPEPWEHGVVETGHGANPVAGEGEDE
jgi:hypothetical protein